MKTFIAWTIGVIVFGIWAIPAIISLGGEPRIIIADVTITIVLLIIVWAVISFVILVPDKPIFDDEDDFG